MSHNHETIICPNCGYHATENYCAQCGQETHLHNDSFWGLIMHFIGHYFHYDSKFWSTMKALWFSPGKLTIAYKEKKRMRYIPPVSLDIFISFVYFFANSLVPGGAKPKINVTHTVSANSGTDSSKVHKADNFILRSVRKSLDNIDNKISEDDSFATEWIMHTVQKIMFFMIPFMGLLLLLVFHRKKEFSYIDHVIFSIHYHALWFSVMLFCSVYSFDFGSSVINGLSLMAAGVYFVMALKKLYRISWLKSVFFSMLLCCLYIVVIIVIILMALITYGASL